MDCCNSPNVPAESCSTFHASSYHFVFASREAKQHILKITAAAGGSCTLFYAALTMERLFSPCTRFRDILERLDRLEHFRRYHSGPLEELNLDVSTEELLSDESAFTYEDLYAILGNGDTIAWLTPRTAVARGCGRALSWFTNYLPDRYRFNFNVDGKEIAALASSPEYLLEICDVVVRLLAASVVHTVHLSNRSNLDDDIYINAPSLAYLMEQCQSLKSLTLGWLKSLDEDHIRVIGASSRLEIELYSCNLTRAGTSTLAEILRRNQGPTKLDLCYIDNSIVANGLRGNSRLKSWRPRFSSDLELRDRELLAIADALRENKGLVDLNLRQYYGMNDETWGVICYSLETHPTLEVLDLRTTGGIRILAPALVKSRMQALLDMMKVNMSIHTIHLNDRHREHELFLGSVIPYLETNRFRPRLLAIQRTSPISYRAKVLGKALLAARTDAKCLWMLLSGNAEVAFPSTTATTSLPPPAPAAATSNVATVAATIAVSVTATRAASTTSASAAAHVATPTDHRKRSRFIGDTPSD
jgi:hypothetical protein